MKDAYSESLLNKGKDMSYVNSVFEGVSTTSFFVSMLLVIITSIIGLKIGKIIYTKHFAK